jgi:hypothetical protein
MEINLIITAASRSGAYDQDSGRSVPLLPILILILILILI